MSCSKAFLDLPGQCFGIDGGTYVGRTVVSCSALIDSWLRPADEKKQPKQVITHMDKPDTLHSRKKLLLFTVLKNLFLYALVPFLLLRLFAQPIGDAVRRSDPAAFRILLVALGTVALNWSVYRVIRRKRPTLLVFAHGVLCLLTVVIIQQEALPGYYALTSTLAIIGGSLTLVFLLLLSYWFASRRSRPAHAAAVCIRVVLGMILCAMAYRVIRNFESRLVTRDTWITVGFMVAVILGFSLSRFFSSFRRTASRRRATGLAEGRIVQIIGETHLDRDGDPVTLQLARVQYTVDEILYEIRADISRYMIWKYGKEAIVGREIPVCYNPDDPADAFANRIDRHILERRDNAGTEGLPSASDS